MKSGDVVDVVVWGLVVSSCFRMFATDLAKCSRCVHLNVVADFGKVLIVWFGDVLVFLFGDAFVV